MRVDFLIAGQGLAGSLLAWTLIQRGCRVLVADGGGMNASQVAAGIVNPITGKRFAKTSDVEIMLSEASDFYRQLSDFFGKPFYRHKKMYRLFRDESESTVATKRLSDSGYAPFLSTLRTTCVDLAEFKTPFGFIEQHQCGQLNTAQLLSHLKNYFIETNSFIAANIAYDAIQIEPVIEWNGITTKQLIFCEGHHAVNNPWFNGSNLVLQPAKGEILTLELTRPLDDAVIHFGDWLLPSSTGSFRIGATYDRQTIDCHPTRAGKSHLLASLRRFYPELAEATVIDHQAGVRPCSRDRNPLVGRHPDNRQLAIFNGFGSKGSLQIPWYSQRFADTLLHNTPLPFSCDIQRFNAIRIIG